MPGPCLALTRPHAHTVKGRGDIGIGPPRRHRPDDRHRFFGRALGMFSGLGLADANLRMLPALPVNGKLDFLPIVVDGGDDILHQRSQQPMPEPHINVWGIPSRFEIVSQAGEIRHGGVLAHLSFVEPRLAGLDTAQRRFPAFLQLSGDQPVIGVAGGIASLGKRGLVTGLLQIQLDHLPPLRFAFEMHTLCLQCRVDRQGLYGAQQFLYNCHIRSSGRSGRYDSRCGGRHKRHTGGGHNDHK